MKRDGLIQFFRGAVIAALPLASSGCHSADAALPVCEPGGFESRDLSTTPCAIFGGGSIVILDGGITDAGCTPCPTLGSTCNEQRNAACEPILVCLGGCVGGRAPAGLAAARAHGDSAVGRYFAQTAHAEAASVPAFRRLRAELRSFGAPAALLDACTVAARDEIRHARSATRLARRFGATPPPVELTPPRPRSVMALAIENVREGCVAETFAALVAMWQRTVVADVDVRGHFDSVVPDEARHAELAWAMNLWLRDRLSAAERAHLHAVRSEALARVAVAVNVAPDAELLRVAGVPAPAVARALHRALAGEIARRA